MQGVHLRKYGVETTIEFNLYEVDGVDLRTNWTPAQSDCEIEKDEGGYTICDNTASGTTTYKIVLTATEMEFARGSLKLVDSATKAFLDDVVHIETYGHASAMHLNFPSDLTHIMGTILTEGASGRLKAAFVKLFDVATPTLVASSVMRGTDSAALAAVVGALADAAAAGEVTEADTLMKYIKQLINILIGTPGIGAFPAAAAPANAVSLAEVIRGIYAGVITNAAGADVAADVIAAKAIVDAIKVVTDWQRSVSGTVVVNNPGTDTIFDLTAVLGTLSTENDAYKNMVITFFDVSGNILETRKISAFVGASGRATIDEALTFPVNDGVDTFILWNKYSPTAAAGGGATAQEVHEYDVSGITTEGFAGYEIQQRGGRNSIYT